MPKAARGEDSLGLFLRMFMYLAWAQVLFEPHRLFGIGKLDSVVAAGAMGVAVLNGTNYLNRRWRLFPLLLLFMAAVLLSFPHMVNTGPPRAYLKLFFQFWILGVATLVTFRNMRHVLPLLYLVSLQYLWWFLHSMPSGRVGWHPQLGDTNALAAVMVIGAGWCYYFGRAARQRWAKWIFGLTAGLCLVAMVPSMARGATLAAGLLIPVVFLRSPNKGKTALGLLLGGVVFIVAANTLLPPGQLYTEISSVFSEGNSTGTGEDRWEVWRAALLSWQAHPITGLGMGNFGPFASNFIQPGQLGGMYSEIPGRLAFRSVHNDWVQILSETGLIGFGIYLAMIVAYFRNGRRLRTRPFREAWARETDNALELKALSLAFETAMTALLITGLLYPQLDRLWFWGLLILQSVIYHNLRELVNTEAYVLARRSQPRRWHLDEAPTDAVKAPEPVLG